MVCLRCEIDMKQYAVEAVAKIKYPNSDEEVSISPKSVYVCEGCGVMEFNALPCTGDNEI